MIESVFATGLPFAGHADLPDILQDLARVLPTCAGVRRYGAAALDLAYVAAGRLDGFWEMGLSKWDIAAGIVLVREAGGFVSDLNGGETYMDTGDIIVHLFRPEVREFYNLEKMWTAALTESVETAS